MQALRCDRLVLATGARERFLPFPGWTLPGVVGVGGIQALCKQGLEVCGRHIVIAGSGPLLLAVAEYLRAAGAEIPLLAEQAPFGPVARFGAGLWRYPAKLRQLIALSRGIADPQAITPSPAKTPAMVRTMRLLIASPRKIRLKIAAKTGIEARIKTTLATLVHVIAKTKAGAVDPIRSM